MIETKVYQQESGYDKDVEEMEEKDVKKFVENIFAYSM